MKIFWTQCVLGLLCIILVGGEEANDEHIKDPKDEERDANKVEASFYMLPLSKWPSMQSTYIKLVVDQATSYCSSEETKEKCGLKTWEEARHNYTLSGNFSEKHFLIQESYPKYKKPYLNVSYVLEFPILEDMDLVENYPTKYYLNKDALEDISGMVTEDFFDETGYSVVAVGHDKYRLPPNNDLNMIMLPVCIVLLVACIVLMVVLRCACKHAHKPEPVDSETENAKVVEVATGENSHDAAANNEQKTAI